MSRAAAVDAQAKLNLRLRVLAREASGYHQLETLFLRIALSDTVRVRTTPSARSLDVSGLAGGATLGPVERNLAWRAAEAYLRASGTPGGFAIELDKRIPVGGGLGGGSADAGAVLRALDALSGAPLGEPALLRLAATLGADVPFLASTAAYALAWGRGERMLALTPPARRRVVLAVPPFGVDTARAFAWLAAARDAEDDGAPSHAGVLDPAALTTWETIADVAGNDFEPPVAARHASVSALVHALRQAGCHPAMMSGSGSVVFGVCSREGVDDRVSAGTLDAAVSGARLVVTESADRVEPVRLLD